MQESYDDSVIVAGKILKVGGVVAFPTETVYGLGADALNPRAAKKIYEAKGRPSDNPLIVHICEANHIEKIAKNISEKTQKVMEKFWPGPITLILEKLDHVPNGTTGGLDTVAVRMPDHVLARDIIREGGGFICAPSANLSGKPSPTKANHVIEDMDGKIDMIIALDNVSIGVESTILDMTTEPPMILRPGAITKQMLEGVIGEVSIDKGILDSKSKEAPRAPGMKYRHYAPKANLIIVEGTKENKIKYINNEIEVLNKKGYKVGVMAVNETAPLYHGDVVKALGQAGTEDIAVKLYDILREFDHLEIDTIFSEDFLGGDLEWAIKNRLEKAAGYQIIKV